MIASSRLARVSRASCDVVVRNFTDESIKSKRVGVDTTRWHTGLIDELTGKLFAHASISPRPVYRLLAFLISTKCSTLAGVSRVVEILDRRPNGPLSQKALYRSSRVTTRFLPIEKVRLSSERHVFLNRINLNVSKVGQQRILECFWNLVVKYFMTSALQNSINKLWVIFYSSFNLLFQRQTVYMVFDFPLIIDRFSLLFQWEIFIRIFDITHRWI